MYLPQRNHTTEGTKRLIVILIEFVFNLFSSCLGKTFYTCIVWFVFNFGSNILIMKLLRHFKKPVCPKGYLHWSDQYLRKRLKAGNKYGLKKPALFYRTWGLCEFSCSAWTADLISANTHSHELMCQGIIFQHPLMQATCMGSLSQRCWTLPAHAAPGVKL